MNGENTSPKRRGRPPKEPEAGKRQNVTVVMAEPIRRAIGEAAEANGRSISSEIDFRLGVSLALDADTASPETRRLLDYVRLVSLALEQDSGKGWTSDRSTAHGLAAAIRSFILLNAPPPNQMTPELEAQKAKFLERIFELRSSPESLMGAFDDLAEEYREFLDYRQSEWRTESEIGEAAVKVAKPLMAMLRIPRPAERDDDAS